MTRRPRPGDLVEVHWIDAAGSEDGTAKAEIVPTRSTGYFVGWRTVKIWGKAERFLVLERNRIGGDFDAGWDATPAGMVRRVVVVRKARV